MNKETHLSDLEKYKRIEFAKELDKVCKKFFIKLKVSKVEQLFFPPLGTIRWFDYDTLGWIDD